ncbi:MAG: N-6 DNA methylase [Candidatus Binatia bacterium]
MTESALIVQKLWNYCNLLRDDGLSYGDYVEQLTFLLFLKMADERRRPPFDRPSPIPAAYGWDRLVALDGDALEIHYRHTLEELGKAPGLLGTIFRKAQNKIQDPAKLRRLIADLIDREQWSALSVDVKGDAYEGLLQKNAEDVKGGAGQYFTPRALIGAVVDVMRPRPGETICDPACGTGGFLLATHEHVRTKQKLDKAQLRHLNRDALRGVELVDGVTRLCAMNLLLHGVGADDDPTEVPILTKDALAAKHGEYDVVLTNPPFGKKSSVTVVTSAGETARESLTVHRDDFWASTSNKQLNFLQHVFSILKQHGRAAVVVPDNVLFEGGAGETVRRALLRQADVHTLLRLPTGIFYAQGVKANVLFFDRKPASESAWTKTLWIYDLRTNRHFTLKERPLARADLDEFAACYHAAKRHERVESQRFRPFAYDELLKRDKVNLDLFWLKDESLEESANLPEPAVIAGEIVDDLEAALEQFAAIADDLKS